MEHGYLSFILLVFLLSGCTLLAGCLSGPSGPAPHTATIPVPVTSTAIPPPESPAAALPASDMALQLSDMPAGYILRDRTVTAYDAISRIFRDLGWKQGYRVSFCRLDKDLDDMTSVIQEIGIYPLENVKEIYSLEKEALLPEDGSTTDYQIPFPQQGDRSIAWREIHTVNNLPVVTYTVIFTKKNVYEKITMTGTSTDYEVLKDIVENSAAKIR